MEENLSGRSEATVKRYHYNTHEQLKSHLANFVDAYNFARRLKTLKGLTPYEFIAKTWTKEPKTFRLDPIHQMPGLNSQRQLAAHHTNQLARNRQVQPRALEAAGVRAVARLETVEDPIARRAARRWPTRSASFCTPLPTGSCSPSATPFRKSATCGQGRVRDIAPQAAQNRRPRHRNGEPRPSGLAAACPEAQLFAGRARFKALIVGGQIPEVPRRVTAAKVRARWAAGQG